MCMCREIGKYVERLDCVQRRVMCVCVYRRDVGCGGGDTVVWWYVCIEKELCMEGVYGG